MKLIILTFQGFPDSSVGKESSCNSGAVVKVTQSRLTFLWLHGLYSPWNSPGQNTGVGSLSLLQGIFPTQGSNPGILYCRWILYQLSHKESPRILEWVAYPFSSRSSRPRNWTGVSCVGKGDGNPLQYSCLENPMDKGTWQATVHRVTKSGTWLKWLSMHACIYSKQVSFTVCKLQANKAAF